MKVLYINGAIHDIADNFFTEFNKVPDKSKMLIYISSDGGGHSNMLAIIDLINRNAERIELIAAGAIYSAAFNIFFRCRCKRTILEQTNGMAHYVQERYLIDQTGNGISDYDRFALKDLKRSKKAEIEIFKQIGLNARELKTIDIGKECYFTYERLKELLEHGKSKKA